MTWKNGEYEAKQSRADEKKQRILNAAMKLFGAKGFHKTTAKHIAAEADISVGSFYRYFKDKKAVLMALCSRTEEEIGGKIFGMIEKMRNEGTSEREIIRVIIETAVKAHHQNIGFHKEILSLQVRDEDVQNWVERREGDIYEATLKFLKSSPEPLIPDDLEAAAELLCYAIEEVAHRAVIFKAYTDEERLTKELQQMVLSYFFKL